MPIHPADEYIGTHASEDPESGDDWRDGIDPVEGAAIDDIDRASLDAADRADVAHDEDASSDLVAEWEGIF